MSEVLIKAIPKPKAQAKPEAKPVAKPIAKPLAKPVSKPEAKPEPKPEPKLKESKQKPVIIREIIKSVPRTKRAPTAFNTFMGEKTKGNAMCFKDAIALWNEQKPKKE